MKRPKLCVRQVCFSPASILYKSIAGRYRSVSYPDGPITTRYRFVKNAYWEAIRHHQWPSYEVSNRIMGAMIKGPGNTYMSHATRKNTFRPVQNVRIRIILHMRKVSSGICFPLKHPVVSNDSVSYGQRRPWSACADAQADLGLRCPHMPEDTFRMAWPSFCLWSIGRR